MDSEDEEADNTLFDDETYGEETDDSDEVEKCGVKKSYEEDEYLDATDLLKSMGEEIDMLRAENESMKKSIEEVQNSMIEVTKSFGDYLKTPNARNSVVEKSMNGATTSTVQNAKPNKADFETLKKSLNKACVDGKITLEEVTFYSSEFQKSMAGKKINPEVWANICSIVRENR